MVGLVLDDEDGPVAACFGERREGGGLRVSGPRVHTDRYLD